jgi:hypothetical protein
VHLFVKERAVVSSLKVIYNFALQTMSNLFIRWYIIYSTCISHFTLANTYFPLDLFALDQ